MCDELPKNYRAQIEHTILNWAEPFLNLDSSAFTRDIFFYFKFVLHTKPGKIVKKNKMQIIFQKLVWGRICSIEQIFVAWFSADEVYSLYCIFLTPYLSELDFSNSPVWNIEFDELDLLQPLLCFKKIKTLKNPSLFTLIWHF